MQVARRAMAGSDASFTEKPIPNAFWRAFSALIYLVPTLDTFSSGFAVYQTVPELIIFQHIGSTLPHTVQDPACFPGSAQKVRK